MEKALHGEGPGKVSGRRGALLWRGHYVGRGQVRGVLLWRRRYVGRGQVRGLGKRGVTVEKALRGEGPGKGIWGEGRYCGEGVRVCVTMLDQYQCSTS